MSVLYTLFNCAKGVTQHVRSNHSHFAAGDRFVRAERLVSNRSGRQFPVDSNWQSGEQMRPCVSRQQHAKSSSKPCLRFPVSLSNTFSKTTAPKTAEPFFQRMLLRYRSGEVSVALEMRLAFAKLVIEQNQTVFAEKFSALFVRNVVCITLLACWIFVKGRTRNQKTTSSLHNW